MKIIKASSGKGTIKMSKSEWESIGKKAGWMKTAKFYDVEYSVGFSPEVKKTKVRVDPGETSEDVIRRLKLKEKQDVIITKYFPVAVKRRKQFSKRDQARMRELGRIKEREKRKREKELQLQQNPSHIQEILNGPYDINIEDDNFLESLRSKRVAQITSEPDLIDTVNIRSVTLDRGPSSDLVDTYISYAEFNDGTPLTDDQMDTLQEDHPGIIGNIATGLNIDRAVGKAEMISDLKQNR